MKDKTCNNKMLISYNVNKRYDVMKIQFNFPESNDYISNLAFIRALMIKKSIEDLNISYKEKEPLKNEILEILKKTWYKFL